MRKSMKQFLMITVTMMIVMMSWEGQKMDAALHQTLIPQESIRLRILANSDMPGDQLVKREIRDAVVTQMNEWVPELSDPESLDEARGMVSEHIPQIKELVGDELAARGLDYAYDVELAVVPFPTKMYGKLIYPAGDYEAVRITLGKGEGQNWWCVLFPPLCFVGGSNGDLADNDPSSEQTTETAAADGTSEPEVRFFLWDLLVKAWNWAGSIFA
ncbi:stage II sporulation protein R [Neobacillus mesonae]|nr:stage II sporulation protein R [Neobacillus mesonae]